ncbi:MAG: hypothetical protein R2762_11490 [Bryobacteraceae bacterium]
MVTSRPYEYAKTPFDANDYPRYALCDFNEAEIKAFIAGWRKIRESSASAAASANRELWGAIADSEQLREMAANPLLLTMITCVHLWKGELPDSRVQLYRVCSESLVDNWSNVAGVAYREIAGAEARIPGELAYWLQASAQPRRRGEELEVSRDDLHGRLEEFLLRKNKDTSLADTLVERFHSTGSHPVAPRAPGGFASSTAASGIFRCAVTSQERVRARCVRGWTRMGGRKRSPSPLRFCRPISAMNFCSACCESRVEDALYCLPRGAAPWTPWLAGGALFG